MQLLVLVFTFLLYANVFTTNVVATNNCQWKLCMSENKCSSKYVCENGRRLNNDDNECVSCTSAPTTKNPTTGTPTTKNPTTHEPTTGTPTTKNPTTGTPTTGTPTTGTPTTGTPTTGTPTTMHPTTMAPTTGTPTTAAPTTKNPTSSTAAPTNNPVTLAPTTMRPTNKPVTKHTKKPTNRPTTLTIPHTNAPTTCGNDMYVDKCSEKKRYHNCVKCQNCTCVTNQVIVHVLDNSYLCGV